MKSFKQFLLESPAPPNKQEIRDYIWKEETQGKEDQIGTVYYPQEKDPTIAGGHSLKDIEHSKQVFNIVFPEKMKDNPQWVDQLVQGKSSMTPEESRKLFDYDTDTRIDQTKKLIKNFDDMSPELQKTLVSSYYRGSLPGSPKTVNLLNSGEYEKAADEYIDNEEYRSSKSRKPHSKTGIVPGRGVYQRMDREREIILSERKRQQEIQQAANQSNSPSMQDKIVSTAVEYAPKVIDMITRTAEPIGGLPKPAPKDVKLSDTSDDTGSMTYTVQAGDNLSKISNNNKQLMDLIVKTNKIKDPNLIKVGQKLIIPK